MVDLESNPQRTLRTADFDYELPEGLIADYPLDKRDESRLLHYNSKSRSLEHRKFRELVEILNPADLLVLNNTKVMPARFFVKASSGTIEVLLTKSASDDPCQWEFMAKPMRKLKIGQTYETLSAKQVRIIEQESKNIKLIDFGSIENFRQIIDNEGSMPIPPYIRRSADDSDRTRYQTIYAQDSKSGASVAAPTAGLHFTEDVFGLLAEKGIELAELTLHVGPGTFLPIKTENISEHKMHSEIYSVSAANLYKIKAAKQEGRRVIAVGTTSARCLESLADYFSSGSSKILSDPILGETDIFIYPGYKFRVVDAMLTNFHLPKSTLILLVAAMIGREEVMRIYNEAISLKYRFYSYGDSMLIY